MAEAYETVKHFRIVLYAAMQIDAVAEMLDAMTGLAGHYLRQNRTGEATELVAFVLNHDDTDEDTRDTAENLFMELESSICPRVIVDAWTKAQEMQLKDFVGEVLRWK